KLRKLVALDEKDPLSRYALGQKLLEVAQGEAELAEAADHLRFANAAAPDHWATYHVLGQVLLRLGLREEARRVLEEGIRRVAAASPGGALDTSSACHQCIALALSHKALQRQAASASSNSRTSPKRRCASFSRQRSTTSRTSSGMPGRTWSGGTGRSSR